MSIGPNLSNTRVPNMPLPIVAPKGATPVLRDEYPSANMMTTPTSRINPNTGFDASSLLHPMGIPGTQPSRTFTGADIRCAVHVLGNGGQSHPVVIANAQTISYSVHREKSPVRALGHSYPVGFVRHSRTIGGSIIFTMFNREVLWDLIQSYTMDVEWNNGDMIDTSFSPMLDQLPPFDITITFANEHGDVANMAIYGVELVDEGTVLSIDDLLVEKTCSFIARDIDMLRPYSDAPNFRAFGKDITNREVTNEDVNAFLNTLKSRRDAINRRSVQVGDSVYAYDIPYDYALFGDTAHHEVQYSTLPFMVDVIYNINGVRWHGWGNSRPDWGPTACEFIPKLSMYPAWSGGTNYRVHDSKLIPGTINETRSGVSSKYLIEVGVDGGVPCTRDQLEVQ